MLDPFSGSGSTGVACLETHRSYVGIEKDESFYEKSRDRLKATWKSTKNTMTWRLKNGQE